MRFATIIATGTLFLSTLSGLSFGASPEEAVSALKRALHPGILRGVSHWGNPCFVEIMHDVNSPSSILVHSQEVGSENFISFYLSAEMDTAVSRFHVNQGDVAVETATRRGTYGLARSFVRVQQRSPGNPALVSLAAGVGMSSPYLDCRLK